MHAHIQSGKRTEGPWTSHFSSASEAGAPWRTDRLRVLLACGAILAVGMLNAPARAQGAADAAREDGVKPRNEQLRSADGPIFRIGSLLGLEAAHER